MVGLNRMMVIGYLGSDPEMRYTANGNAVTSFSIATTRSYTGSDGERQQETEWFRVSAWNQLAELCNQYLSKGSKAYVDGRLRSNSWQTQDGQTRFTMEITADTVHFLDRPSRSGQLPSDNEEALISDADDLPF